MAVPVPVDISINPPPVGFKGNYPKDLLKLIATSLSGTMEVSLLTGKVGGTEPGTNVGPWLNGTEWYVPSAKKGNYVPSAQGCPIGTVAMWGGHSNIPSNWLLCAGQALPTTGIYTDLFQAIGYTWGASGGNFLLPPGGYFFLNAPNFIPASQIPIVPGSPSGGVNVRGGSQRAVIPPDAMPALTINFEYFNIPEMIDANINVPNVQSGGTSGYAYPVTDENGNILGANQQAIAIMPPFAAVNFIIKYL